MSLDATPYLCHRESQNDRSPPWLLRRLPRGQMFNVAFPQRSLPVFHLHLHLPSSISTVPPLRAVQPSHSFVFFHYSYRSSYPSIPLSFIYHSMLDFILSFSRWNPLHIIARIEPKSQTPSVHHCATEYQHRRRTPDG